MEDGNNSRQTLLQIHELIELVISEAMSKGEEKKVQVVIPYHELSVAGEDEYEEVDLRLTIETEWIERGDEDEVTNSNKTSH